MVGVGGFERDGAEVAGSVVVHHEGDVWGEGVQGVGAGVGVAQEEQLVWRLEEEPRYKRVLGGVLLGGQGGREPLRGCRVL